MTGKRDGEPKQLLVVQLNPDVVEWIDECAEGKMKGAKSQILRTAIDDWLADPDNDILFGKQLAKIEWPRHEQIRRSVSVTRAVYRALKFEALRRDVVLADIVGVALLRYRKMLDQQTAEASG